MTVQTLFCMEADILTALLHADDRKSSCKILLIAPPTHDAGRLGIRCGNHSCFPPFGWGVTRTPRGG